MKLVTLLFLFSLCIYSQPTGSALVFGRRNPTGASCRFSSAAEYFSGLIFTCPNNMTFSQLSGGGGTGTGNVVGPATSSVNFIPQWGNTTGTLLNPGLFSTSTGGAAGAVPIATTGGYLNSAFIPPPRTGSGVARIIARNNEIFFCTGACTVTPLVPFNTEQGQVTGGQSFCVRTDDNLAAVITLAAIPNVSYENTSRTSYKPPNTTLVSSGAIGDQICMVARSLTQYNVLSFSGTWN